MKVTSERDQNNFFRAAQEFYKESLIYVINKLPVNEPFWKAAVWVNYFNRPSASWNDVTISVFDMPVC